MGAKLLCIQGASFSFIGPIISAGMMGGLPLIFGACIAASPIEMIISRTFKYMRSIITPLVSGIVVLLIGLSLIKVGVVSCGGGFGTMDNGTFGRFENLGVAAGIRIIASQDINRKATLALAVSLSLGLSVELIDAGYSEYDSRSDKRCFFVWYHDWRISCHYLKYIDTSKRR